MDTALLSKENNFNEDSNEILYFSINQDYKYLNDKIKFSSCIAVGTKSGFKIFSADPFQMYYESSIIN